MRFRTFRIIGLLVVIGVCISTFAAIKSLINQRPAPAAKAIVMPVAPVQVSTPLAVSPQPRQSLSTAQIRSDLDAWLQANPDRQGKTKSMDILSAASFRATAIRFPDDTAGKWSDDPRQWSQIRLDLDRDGTDDEKWLLKNGHTYKREVLDRSGKVTATEYF